MVHEWCLEHSVIDVLINAYEVENSAAGFFRQSEDCSAHLATSKQVDLKADKFFFKSRFVLYALIIRGQ